MSVSVYLPMYSKDEDLAAMLCLAGTTKNVLGWGIFYYPFFFCPTEDGSSILLDVFCGQTEIHTMKTGLIDAPAKIYEARKSYTSFIQAISETKKILERTGSKIVVLRNLITDMTVLSEARDGLARCEFEAIEGATEIEDDADLCETVASFDDAKCNLFLNISLMDELVDSAKNAEKFLFEMMDKEKEVNLRNHEETMDGARLQIEKKIEKMEKRIDSERIKINKRLKSTRLRLESRLKKMVSRQREEEKKAVTYEERGRKSKKKSWLNLAKRYEERTKKWSKKVVEVEKAIEKAEEEAGKQLKRLEEEREKWAKESKDVLEEWGKEREEILWKFDQRKRFASTVSQDLYMKAHARKNSQIGVLNSLIKCKLEVPLKERTKMHIPFIAVKSSGDVLKAFTFILPKTIDTAKKRGILGLTRPSLKNSLWPIYENLFRHIEENLKTQSRKGRITSRLVEGTTNPPSMERFFGEVPSKGLEKLVAMKLLEPTAANEYVSKLRAVSEG